MIRKPPRGNQGGGDTRRILDQRLARGDIDEAEYLRLHDLIGSGEQDPVADSK